MKFINCLLLFSGIVSNFTILAQSECYTANEVSFYPKSGLSCSELEDYSPISSDETPIITVRIDFHIFQKSDGSGNFENTPTDISVLESFIDSINYRLSHLNVIEIGTSNYIQDSKIRVTLDGIYFHTNTDDWNFSPTPRSSSYPVYQKYVINDYSNYGLTYNQKYNVKHILFTGGLMVGMISVVYFKQQMLFLETIVVMLLLWNTKITHLITASHTEIYPLLKIQPLSVMTILLRKE